MPRRERERSLFYLRSEELRHLDFNRLSVGCVGGGVFWVEVGGFKKIYIYEKLAQEVFNSCIYF